MRSKWKNPSASKTYYAWRSMRDRCTNPTSHAWMNYGGRGVSVCEQWLNDYDAFFSDMGECPQGMTLDRINVDLGYAPGNCRWVGWDVQANNKRCNVLLSQEGETLSVAQWADRLGVKRATIYARLSRYKMAVDRALTPGLLDKAPVAACGTRGGYDNGCRCAECQSFNTQRARAYRAKKRALGAEIAAGDA